MESTHVENRFTSEVVMRTSTIVSFAAAIAIAVLAVGAVNVVKHEHEHASAAPQRLERQVSPATATLAPVVVEASQAD